MLRWPLVAGTAAIALAAFAISPLTTAGAAPPPPTPGTPLTSAQAGALAKGKQQGVVVLLKNQHPEAPPRTAPGTRASLVKRDQGRFLSELKQVKASKVKSYNLVNGFAASVTAAEAARLAADPAVASVSTDHVYALPKQDLSRLTTPTGAKTSALTGIGSTLTKSRGAKAAARPAAASATASGLCPSDPSKPLLEPEALQVSHTAYADPTTPQAARYATGKGVKVAFLADGMDINNPDFIRPDGSKVFVDYQNFGGNGDQSDARESFGDASSLAAQGNTVYDLSNYADPKTPLPKGCNVRIRGMAPDVSLVGINLSGPVAFFNDSTIVQAIDYAVTVDKVDIVNESLGGLGLPATTSSPVVAANDAAVAAGVTVVASTGDQGPTGTMGSPALDPKVIAAGGSTAFRVLAQSSWGGYQLSNGTWASNNISSFASAGTSQQGRAPDLIAPAERGWAACTADLANYSGCHTYDGRPTNIFPFGGTSESSPLIAGEAALVIQAYKDTHAGAKPSPDLVKRLLTSTATDLRLPSNEQGAGLFNALAAVKAARAYKATAADGVSLVSNKAQMLKAVPAGTTASNTVAITNASATTQTVSAHGRTLGSAVSDDKGTITLDSTASGLPTFYDSHYLPGDRVYVKRTFTVPKNVDYLAASIAYATPDDRNAEPQVTLLDPSGTFAAASYTSAGAGFGRVDVRAPAAGTWTEIFATSSANGFKGGIAFDNTTRKFVDYGTVTPSSVSLKPGASATFTISSKPGSPSGDIAASVQFSASGVVTSVPYVVRPVITTSYGAGAFSGTLSGANGGPNTQQYKGYSFDVPKGQRDLSVSIKLANPNTVVYATAVDPSGQPLSLTTDVYASQYLTGTLQLYRVAPTPGRWLLAISQLNPANGTQTSFAFTGKLAFNTVSASVKGLPSGTVTAGKAVTATVTVKNTSATPLVYFVDGRLDGKYADLPIISPNKTTGIPLGNVGGGAAFPVPTRTTALTFTGTSTVPITLDAGFYEPSYFGPSSGNSATVLVAGNPLAQGYWFSDATLVGPTGGTVHNETVDLTATAHTQVFDPAVVAASGDVWKQSVDAGATFTPVVLAPGATGTITVTVTPSGAKGTVVHGTLYMDDYNSWSGDGDELAALPYTYTIG